ncbi:hypothetical protein TWF703_006833 [Orbilia oligospora]|uniref:LysM domain-containing protein n=1 Tax=Orbilia oligospora TaxID=2813651 RepID=A0A7C8JTJ3_ORBOL|nr:hypothetical protein TWF703_006833 [Orbilia oligospora]
MVSLLKGISVLASVGAALAYVPRPYGYIQARGTLVSDANRVSMLDKEDVAEGCNLWFLTYEGDTCNTILTTTNISMEDLINWNPSLEDGNCDDLIQTGADYCVGMDKPDPPAKPTPPPTRSTPQPLENVITTPSPIQPGMTRSCTNFHFVKSGEGCLDIIPRYPGLTIELLYQWNPAIGETCNKMWAETYICVSVSDMPTREPTTTRSPGKQMPSPIGEGTTPNCKRWGYVKTGDNCQTIIDRNNLKATVKDLYLWNRSIKPDCSSLVERNYLCISGPANPRALPPTTTMATTMPTTMATTTRTIRSTTTVRRTTTTTQDLTSTPSPLQPGTVEGCKKWAYVKDGQTCNDVLTRFEGLTLETLVRWNPAIGAGCTSLWARTYVCVNA